MLFTSAYDLSPYCGRLLFTRDSRLNEAKGVWHKAAPEKMYRYDYIVALIMHGFSWAFMIMLPIAISMEFQCPIGFIFAFLVNFIVHALVDNMKANERRINLICDQSIHIAQIILTFLAFT